MCVCSCVCMCVYMCIYVCVCVAQVWEPFADRIIVVGSSTRAVILPIHPNVVVELRELNWSAWVTLYCRSDISVQSVLQLVSKEFGLHESHFHLMSRENKHLRSCLHLHHYLVGTVPLMLSVVLNSLLGGMENDGGAEEEKQEPQGTRKAPVVQQSPVAPKVSLLPPPARDSHKRNRTPPSPCLSPAQAIAQATAQATARFTEALDLVVRINALFMRIIGVAFSGAEWLTECLHANGRLRTRSKVLLSLLWCPKDGQGLPALPETVDIAGPVYNAAYSTTVDAHLAQASMAADDELQCFTLDTRAYHRSSTPPVTLREDIDRPAVRKSSSA